MEQIDLLHTLPAAFNGQTQIVSDVWHRELVFRKGEAYLLEAASGTGKSSLCSYLYGYRNDYEGIICFDGRNIRKLGMREWTALRNTSLSLLFQELRLFPELSAQENVELKNRLTGYKTRRQIEACFGRLGIADKLHVAVGRNSF